MPAKDPITGNRRDRQSEAALDEYLALLSLLDPAPALNPKTGCPTVKRPETVTSGQKFLDHLSWLCDPLPRGKTVASIAVQDGPNETKFWIANNSGNSSAVEKHLQWLLLRLRQFTDNPEAKASIFKAIYWKSVRFNHKRIGNYLVQLSKVAPHCLQLQETNQTGRDQLPLVPCLLKQGSDCQLSQHIREMLALEDDHERLCMLAFHFRESTASHTLREKAAGSGPNGCWQILRHYVGRLGSWWKATTIVLTKADELSHILRNATVHTVRHGHFGVQGQIKPRRSLDDVLQSLASANAPDLLQAGKCVMQHRWGPEVDKKFTERLQSRRKQQCFHAEVVMLSHFHRQGYRFSRSLPYIGCSKPSCYCCKTYTELHPLRTAPRQSHGNAWVKWGLPCPTRVARGRYCHGCAGILEEMLQRLRREIRQRILAGNGAISGRLESTTNMSSVALLGSAEHE